MFFEIGIVAAIIAMACLFSMGRGLGEYLFYGLMIITIVSFIAGATVANQYETRNITVVDRIVSGDTLKIIGSDDIVYSTNYLTYAKLKLGNSYTVATSKNCDMQNMGAPCFYTIDSVIT